MKEGLAVLDKGEPGDAEYEEALTRVMAEVRHHVPEEEACCRGCGRRSATRAWSSSASSSSAPRRPRPRAPTPTPPRPSSPRCPPPWSTRCGTKTSDRDAEAATDASGLLDPQAQAVVDRMASLGVKPLRVLTPDQARRQPTATDGVMALMKDRGQEGPEPVGDVEQRRIPGPAGDVLVRVYTPQDSSAGAALPVLVHIHGGSWVIADLDVYERHPPRPGQPGRLPGRVRRVPPRPRVALPCGA